MKLGIFIILALALGVFGAHFLLEDTGYVLIDFRGTAIEMSVPFMIFALPTILPAQYCVSAEHATQPGPQ